MRPFAWFFSVRKDKMRTEIGILSRILVFSLCVISSFGISLFAAEVIIGTDTTTAYEMPWDTYTSYSYTQMIYLSSELNTSGEIDYIKYYYDGNAYTWNNMVVYMGHTAKATYASEEDWIAVGSLTQVYSGSIALTATAGWHTITLDSAFTYNGTDNLVIAIDDNHGGWIGSTNAFRYSSTSTNYRCLRYRDYSINPDPASPSSGFRSYNRPNITINATPTLVNLHSFIARGFQDFIRLEWATATELNSAGFHLWRCDTKDGEYNRITDYLIPAAGTSILGAKYEYEDLDPEQGRAYFYKLEEIDYSNDSAFFGPVSARLRLMNFKAPFQAQHE